MTNQELRGLFDRRDRLAEQLRQAEAAIAAAAKAQATARGVAFMRVETLRQIAAGHAH